MVGLRGSRGTRSSLIFADQRIRIVSAAPRIVGGSDVMACGGAECEKCMCVGPSGVGIFGASCSRGKVDISGICCSGMVRVYMCRKGGVLCNRSVAGGVFTSVFPTRVLGRTVLTSVGFVNISDGKCRCRTALNVPRDSMCDLMGVVVNFSYAVDVRGTRWVHFFCIFSSPRRDICFFSPPFYNHLTLNFPPLLLLQPFLFPPNLHPFP